MEVTEGTDKAHLGVAGPVDVVMEFQRHGATHHVNLHHTAQCHVKDRKTTERRPPSQEMSRAKPNKKSGLVGGMRIMNITMHRRPQPRFSRDCKDRLGSVTTTLHMWLFCKQLPVG